MIHLWKKPFLVPGRRLTQEVVGSRLFFMHHSLGTKYGTTEMMVISNQTGIVSCDVTPATGRVGSKDGLGF
jgi:hypothetical protein